MAGGQGHKKAHAQKNARKGGMYQEKVANQLDMVSDLAASGLSINEIAKTLGVATTTVRAWMAKHIDFRLAITDGRTKACHDIEGALIKRAMGYEADQVEKTEITNADGEVTQVIEKTVTKHIPPDMKAAEFFLKNRDMKRWNKGSNDTNVTGGVLLIPHGDTNAWSDSVKEQQQALIDKADRKVAEICNGESDTE